MHHTDWKREVRAGNQRCRDLSVENIQDCKDYKRMNGFFHKDMKKHIRKYKITLDLRQELTLLLAIKKM